MHRNVFGPFLAAGILISPGFPLAAQGTAAANPQAAPSGAVVTPAQLKANGMERAKEKAALLAKQIDLNSASKEALMKIPGITAELAARIIAGRPYLTKANLVTHKIMTLALYQSIKDQVAARQKAATK
jgi:DNA uptake protein ComE-like DNA-binding protein